MPGLKRLLNAILSLAAATQQLWSSAKYLNDAQDDNKARRMLEDAQAVQNATEAVQNATGKVTGAVAILTRDDAASARRIGRRRRTKTPTTPPLVNAFGDVTKSEVDYRLELEDAVYFVLAPNHKNSPISVTFGDGDNTFGVEIKPFIRRRGRVIAARLIISVGPAIMSRARVVGNRVRVPVACDCYDGEYIRALTPDGRTIEVTPGQYAVVQTAPMLDPENSLIVTIYRNKYGDVSFTAHSTRRSTMPGYVDGVYRDDWPLMSNSWSASTKIFSTAADQSKPENIALATALGRAHVSVRTQATASQDEPSQLFDRRNLSSQEFSEAILAHRFASLRGGLFTAQAESFGYDPERLDDSQLKQVNDAVNAIDLLAEYKKKYRGKDPLLEDDSKNARGHSLRQG